MVIDTSALVAILEDEEEAQAFGEAIEAAARCLLSAPSLVEVSMVIEARHGGEGLRDLDLLLAKAQIEVVPCDREQAEIARRAFSRFGKGRHSAGLNFGDCFSYALAEFCHEALLYKGDDFSKTDIGSALE